MRPLTVFVQTCPQRVEDIKPTLHSLLASDVTEHGDLVIMEHPAELTRCRFYRSVLQAMADADSEYVIRCEDDILVNRHLAHNFLTWPALEHKSFGCGWLYVSELALADNRTIHTPCPSGTGSHAVRNTRTMYGSLCVGMPVEHARWCLELLDQKIERFGCPLSGCIPGLGSGDRCRHASSPMKAMDEHGQDTLLSQAVWDRGKRVFFHAPVLAENRLIPSVRGTPFGGVDTRHLKAGRHFAPDWRRA